MTHARGSLQASPRLFALVLAGLFVVALFGCAQPAPSTEAEHGEAGLSQQVTASDHHGDDHHHHATCTVDDIGPAPTVARTAQPDRAVVLPQTAPLAAATTAALAARDPGSPSGETGRDLLLQLAVSRT